MENDKKKVTITIKNLGPRHHIFGAVHVHPDGKNGKPDTSLMPVCLHPTETLAPGGSVTMTPAQFKFYDDEALEKKVNEREFAILANGKDIRPDLAKRDPKPAPGKELKATESAESAESSVLAEIMAEGDPKPE